MTDKTGSIGMAALDEFRQWNCEKPAGLRLMRTACELIGKKAKMPHGIPSNFEAYLTDGIKIIVLFLSTID